MLDVIHHTLEQLEEILPRRSTKEKPLHEVPMAAIDRLQVGDALFRNLEAMKIYIRSSNTQNSEGSRSLVLNKSNRVKKAMTSLIESVMVAELLPTLNWKVEATSTGDGPEKKYEVQHEFTRNRENEVMDLMMKALIEV